MNTKILGILLVVVSLLMYRFPQLTDVIYGVCLFLYAMSMFGRSLQMFPGMEGSLKKMTKTRLGSLSFGVVATAIVQSSSLTSVLTISFLSAGLITLGSGLAIIYGANLGSVAAVWLAAVLGINIDIAQYAIPLIVIGLCCMGARVNAAKGTGYFLFGIGLIFLGIAHMKTGFETLHASMDIAQYSVTGFKGILIFTALGIAMTVIMQSSAAVLALTIAALGVQQIAYENAIAIAIGSNVGSTMTAILGALGANSEGRKLGVAHVIFNSVTAILALIAMPLFLRATDAIADASGVKEGNYIIRLTIFHTLFNIVGICLFYPLIDLMKKLLNRFVRSRSARVRVAGAGFLSDDTLKHPTSSLRALAEETRHLYVNTASIMAKSISVTVGDIRRGTDAQELAAMRRKPIHVDFDTLYRKRFQPIYEQIIGFSARAISRASWQDLDGFIDMRRTALLLDDSLKNMKHAQVGICRFVDAENAYIRKEYDRLRVRIIQTLRFVYKVSYADAKNQQVDIKSLIRDLRKIYRPPGNDIPRINNLLLEGKISSAMTASLMHDMEQVHGVTEKLMQAAELLARHAGHIDFELLKISLGMENEEEYKLEEEKQNTGLNHPAPATAKP